MKKAIAGVVFLSLFAFGASFALAASSSSVILPAARGDSGANVVAIQNVLIAQGYLKAMATGYFGAETQAAVEAFQSANGLATVGNVGPKTRALLGSLVASGSLGANGASASSASSSQSQSQVPASSLPQTSSVAPSPASSATAETSSTQTATVASACVLAPTIATASSSVSQYIATDSGTRSSSEAVFKLTSPSAATVSEVKYAVIGTVPGTVSSVTVGSTSVPVVTPTSAYLSGAITSTATTIELTPTAVQVGTVLTVGPEQMLVTAVSGSTFTVTRGVNGTAASSALNGATVIPSGVADITGLSIAVPAGTTGANITAHISYSAVGLLTIPSSTHSTLLLSYLAYACGSTTAVSNPSVAAPIMTLVGSAPTLAVDTTAHSGFVVGTDNKIGSTSIAADTDGSIGINQIRFDINESGFVIAPMFLDPLISDSGTVVPAGGSSCVSSGSTSVVCTFSGLNGYVVPAGQTKTFSLFATVGGTARLGATTVSLSSQVDSSSFDWTDVAGGGASGVLTGSLIYLFPTGEYVIHK